MISSVLPTLAIPPLATLSKLECLCVCVCVCSVVLNSLRPHSPGFSGHGIFPSKNTGVGCRFFL